MGLFELKKLPDGRFPLEWNPINKYLKPGTKGEINKWITFYAYLLFDKTIILGKNKKRINPLLL